MFEQLAFILDLTLNYWLIPHGYTDDYRRYRAQDLLEAFGADEIEIVRRTPSVCERRIAPHVWESRTWYSERRAWEVNEHRRVEERRRMDARRKAGLPEPKPYG